MTKKLYLVVENNCLNYAKGDTVELDERKAAFLANKVELVKTAPAKAAAAKPKAKPKAKADDTTASTDGGAWGA